MSPESEVWDCLATKRTGIVAWEGTECRGQTTLLVK